MKIYEATKHFVILHNFGVAFHGVSDGPFEDQVMTVDHVPLVSEKPSFVSPDPKYCTWNSDMGDTNLLNDKSEIDSTVVSYILTFKGNQKFRSIFKPFVLTNFTK